MLKIFILGFFFVLTSLNVNCQSFELLQSFNGQSELTDANGVTVADYDLDGDLDIYIVASEVFDENDPTTWSRLLRNDLDAGFIDVTEASNLINRGALTKTGIIGSKLGASWGDYDNDGYPDVFISNHGLDELWHNERNGTFINVTEKANIQGCSACYSTNGVWWDYDKDGDLDLYVSDWIKANRLYRNDGDGNFKDLSRATGLDDRRNTFTSLPIDVNNDGLLDLYVINDNEENRFFWNKGNDVFEEATEEVGLSNIGNGMGADICDFNNDGLFDIYVTNIHFYLPNPFFVNGGDDSFKDQSEPLGISNTGWGWGARFFDADHDLDEDLYVVNGFSSAIAEGDRNMFFKNQDGTFNEISAELGLNNEAWGMGQEVFDYDQDGDLDIITGNRNAHVSLFHSNVIEESAGNSNWIQLQLEGTTCNKNAYGAVVKITCDGIDYYRYHSGVNLFGQSYKPVHFGLGNHPHVDNINVKWPDGLVEDFGVTSSNQLITLIQGEGQSDSENIVLSLSDGFQEHLVYPNPFEDELIIEFLGNSNLPLKFTVTNIMGSKVLEDDLQPADKLEITGLSKLPVGVYFYVISNNKTEIKGKVLKQ